MTTKFNVLTPLINTAHDMSTLNDMQDWCDENIGERRKHWDRVCSLEGWTYTFYDEKATTMFILRWS